MLTRDMLHWPLAMNAVVAGFADDEWSADAVGAVIAAERDCSAVKEEKEIGGRGEEVL